MLQTLANFFQWFWDILTSIYNLVGSLVKGLLNLIKALPSIISTATNAIGYLPSVLIVFATLTITISVVYLIVGRDTGGS